MWYLSSTKLFTKSFKIIAQETDIRTAKGIERKFPLGPMGVLASGSVHARPSAQTPIDRLPTPKTLQNSTPTPHPLPLYYPSTTPLLTPTAGPDPGAAPGCAADLLRLRQRGVCMLAGLLL